MPVLIAIFRFFVSIVPFFGRSLKYLGWIWRFLKSLSLNPAVWTMLALAPTISLIYELFTGNQGFLSPVINTFLAQILSTMLNVVFEYDMQQQLSLLDSRVLNVSCYLGVTEALQIIVNGLVNAMIILIVMRINLFIAILKIKMATIRRM